MNVEPHSGLVLAGRYQLERELGRGGMGSVWLATHTTLHSRVAVKVLSTNVSMASAESRFLFEARAAAGLNNPHVVHLSDFGVHEGRPFLVMELLEGETLASRLSREGKLSPLVTARILAQVCRGVASAHDAGIVHRDLKPENVFLLDSGHDLLVKVLDFGVAKALQLGSAPSPTETGTTVGTIPYMAPEQIADSKRVGIAADVWSLGVVAFECLIGERPFRAENVATLVYTICHERPPVPSRIGSVPDGFDAWFARTTAAEPEQRWTSVDDAAAELGRLCGVAPSDTTAAPKTLPTRNASAPGPGVANTGSPVVSNPSPPRASRWPWVVAAGVVVAAGLAIWFSTSNDDSSPSAASSIEVSESPAPASSVETDEQSGKRAESPEPSTGDPPEPTSKPHSDSEEPGSVGRQPSAPNSNADETQPVTPPKRPASSTKSNRRSPERPASSTKSNRRFPEPTPPPRQPSEPTAEPVLPPITAPADPAPKDEPPLFL